MTSILLHQKKYANTFKTGYAPLFFWGGGDVFKFGYWPSLKMGWEYPHVTNLFGFEAWNNCIVTAWTMWTGMHHIMHLVFIYTITFCGFSRGSQFVMYFLSCLCLVSQRVGPLGPISREMSGEKPGFNGVEAEACEQDPSTASVVASNNPITKPILKCWANGVCCGWLKLKFWTWFVSPNTWDGLPKDLPHCYS